MSNFLVKSLNLGLIDSALNWLIGALTTLLQLIINWTIDLFILIFADFLYSIGLTLLSFVDFFQAFFNALCGMGTYWDSNGVKYVDQDPILSLITNQTVLQVFLALTIVAIIMLILTTIIAMVRTEFTTEGAKNSKGTILGSALKSLAMFFIVPAACVLGIVLSNGLLNAVNVATTGGDNVSAGAMVWYASSYNANRVRINSEEYLPDVLGDVLNISEKVSFYSYFWNSDNAISKDFDLAGSVDTNRETVAIMIDNAFKNRTTSITTKWLAYVGTEGYSFTDLMSDNTTDADFVLGNNVYSYRNVLLTEVYYSVRHMNFLVMFLGGGIAVYIMFIAAFGLIIRLYKVAILFMVSAPITAISPLDGGAAYKSWRKLMIGSVASAFSVVIAFNLIFMLIPLMANINIFNTNISTVTGVWNRLVNLLFVLTGLYSIKETSKWVSSMLNIEDPLSAGSEISGKVMGTVGKMGTFVGAGVAAQVMRFGAARKGAQADALSDKLQEQEKSGNPVTEEQKAGLAKKVSAYQKSKTRADAVSLMSKKVRKDTVTKSFNRFDNFMGGANVFGGADENNLGGLINKGADRADVVNRASGKIFGATHSEYKGEKRKIKEIDKALGTLDGDSRTISGKKYDTDAEYETEMNRLITEKKSLESSYNSHRDKEKKGAYALFNGTTNTRGENANDAYSQDTAAKKQMADKLQIQANTISLDIDDITRMKNDKSKSYNSYKDVYNDNETAKDKVKSIAQATGRTESAVLSDLDNPNGADNVKASIANASATFNNKIMVEAGSFDDIGEDIKNILQEMLSRSGVKGASLDEQFRTVSESIKDNIKKEFDDQKREMDRIKELAVQIAKMNKKFNPPAKK